MARARQVPGFDSPEPALDRAVHWAVSRSGGHLRVEPWGTAADEWDDDEARALIEDARLWARVRSDRIFAPQELLERVVGGMLGARIDGAGGRLELRPSLPEGWKSLVVRRLRAHRTLLDLEIKPRAEWLTVRLAVVFGPPLAVLVRSREANTVSRVAVDEVPLDASHAIFTAQGEHEVTLYRG